MADLKPCPFCGGEAKIERHDQNDNCTVYVCRECGCTLPSGDWRDGSSWNDRVCEAENASLRQQLAEARETAAKIAYDAKADFERQANTSHGVAHDALLMAADALELVGDAIRALPHPEREGERE